MLKDKLKEFKKLVCYKVRKAIDGLPNEPSTGDVYRIEIKVPHFIGDFHTITGYKGKPFNEEKFYSDNQRNIKKLLQSKKRAGKIKVIVEQKESKFHSFIRPTDTAEFLPLRTK